MASSAFSFHCMICFEEFDPQTNYPVVLPCGHTYVCIECANRLDKCMECRTPLHVKVDLPPPPPPPAGTAGGGRNDVAMTPGTPAHRPIPSGGAASPAATAASPDQKENHAANRYADRVRNSPGFRRRYGHRDEYSNKRHPYAAAPAPAPPQAPVPKQRLPLPKNAVLLSLIQASQPMRSRAEVEAPPTPQKTEVDATGGMAATPLLGGAGSDAPSPGNRGLPATNASHNNGGLPKFSRPSPLFLDGSSSGEHDAPPGLVGSQPDDEEHKIRVGTYLEGGPCGTYAVASRNGLLVYPTLFEHALPSALGKLRRDEEDVDVVKRDVEEVVKNYYRESAGTRNFPRNNGDGGADRKKKNKAPKKKKERKNDDGGAMVNDPGSAKKKGAGTAADNLKTSSNETNIDGETTADDSRGPAASPAEDSAGGVSHTTWVECCHDDNVEAQVTEFLPESLLSSGGSLGSQSPSPAGASIPMLGEYRDSDEGSDGGERPRSDPGGIDAARLRPLAACASLDAEDAGLSLTVSDDDDDDSADGGDGFDVGASIRTLPARRSRSIAARRPSSPEGRSGSPLSTSMRAGRAKDGGVTKKFVRHFSQGTYLAKKRDGGADGGGDGGANGNDNGAINSHDEFERPLIRLKYGDRVQVVSMDSRGWVKLARGYGYIRLENDKQLVKVGGTSDKACQIEAMLHDLSIERNRLKQEQTKLERLSAGLMIDLQSSLLTSEDHVVVPAPEGSLLRADLPGDRAASNVSLDDIDVSTRSRTVLTPPRSNNVHVERAGNNPNAPAHREIRTAKSHSPGRSSSLPAAAGVGARPKAPPSPPYGQVTSNIHSNNWSSVNTPTRVNFRTGLSGHRALTSSHSHPHDFIATGEPIRSMSNHAGISSTKKPKPGNRGRSIY